MSRIGTLMVCAAMLALGFGCDDGRGGDEDGGGIVLMDSGTGDPPDTGVTPPPDSGPADTCPPAMAPAPDPVMVCAESTLTCLMGAGTAEAQQACIDADPNPMACNGCLTQEIFNRCTTGAGGCADEYGEVNCCLEETCAGAADPTACVNMATAAGGACSGQSDAFFSCIGTAGCAMISGQCFMMGSGFNPDFRSFEPFPSLFWSLDPAFQR